MPGGRGRHADRFPGSALYLPAYYDRAQGDRQMDGM